jgi:hypothetical protein
VNRQINIQQTHLDMLTNKVKTARIKLQEHRNLGPKSNLSVYEAARLMDMIRRGEKEPEKSSGGIFFSLN